MKGDWLGRGPVPIGLNPEGHKGHEDQAFEQEANKQVLIPQAFKAGTLSRPTRTAFN